MTIFFFFTEKGPSRKGTKIISGVNQSFARCRVENKVCAHLIIVSDFTTVHITAGNIWIFHRACSTPILYMSIAVFSVLTYKLTCIAIIYVLWLMHLDHAG